MTAIPPRRKKKVASKPRRPAPLAVASVGATPVSVGILPNLLGYNVRRAQIALWRDFNRTVGTGIVRPGSFSLMVLVQENPGIAQVDLATQLAVDKATIVGLIHRLQRQGWIERRQSVADRRRHGVYLTAAGKRELTQLRREMVHHEARFLRLFTRQELGQFFDFLRRIQI